MKKGVETLYQWPKEIPSEDYIRLYFLEKALRRLIKDRLSNITNKWWRQRVQGEIWKKAEDRKKEEEQRLKPTIDLHPICYVDFLDYREMITRDDNWREAFRHIFRNKDDFRVTLAKLAPIRNKIAHMRPLSIREQKNLDALSEDVLVHIWNFYNEQYLKPAEKLMKEGKFQQAEKILLQGYEETGDDPWIAYLLGELYEKMQRLEEARKWFDYAVKNLVLHRYKKLANEKLQRLEEKIRLCKVRICPKCGSEAPKDHSYCGKCGYEF